MSDANVSKKMTLIQKLDNTSAVAIASLPEVEEKFKKIYSIMNGGHEKVATLKFESEKFHFSKLMQDNPALQQCTRLSLYGCFMDMAVNGLSFDPSMKQAYVVSFNTNVGTKDNPRWEKRATLMISGYGELVMRMQQKQVKYADNPILVYEGDYFVHGTKDGRVYLEHTAKFPRQSDNIIASYLRIERIDGTVDYKVLSIEEIMKLRKFSKDPNSKAWTDGLPGMVQAKTMKHAFRSYPKIKLGQFSELQSETVEAEAQDLKVIDYGLNDEAAPVASLPAVDDNSFVAPPQAQPAQTVSFNDDNF